MGVNTRHALRGLTHQVDRRDRRFSRALFTAEMKVNIRGVNFAAELSRQFGRKRRGRRGPRKENYFTFAPSTVSQVENTLMIRTPRYLERGFNKIHRARVFVDIRFEHEFLRKKLSASFCRRDLRDNSIFQQICCCV